MSSPERLGDLACIAAIAERTAQRTADHVERLWQDELARFSACLDGDCLYASRFCHSPPEGRRSQRRCWHDHRCSGWEAVKHVQDGQPPLLRYRLCPHHRAFVAQDVARLRGQRTAAPRTWTEEAP